MRVEVKLTSKGQLTLPKEIRDRLGLEKGTTMAVELKGDEISIKKARPVRPLDDADPVWDMVGMFYDRGNSGGR